MRKYALMLLLLCLHGMARGQTSGYDYFYWFDEDPATLQWGTSAASSWQLAADASGLNESLHSVRIVVVDEKGRQSQPATRVFMHSNDLSDKIQAYYWFDAQNGAPMKAEVLNGQFNVDVSSLSDGLHAFYYKAQTVNGKSSAIAIRYFIKKPLAASIIPMQGFYWFDDEQIPRRNLSGSGDVFEVDATMLSDGFHQFHYMALQNGNTVSPASSNYFLKVAHVAEKDSLTCICSVDGQLRHVEKLPSQGGVIHWEMDMYDIPDGVHSIQLQALTRSGAMCKSFNTYFIRATTAEELGQMRCLYSIDNEAFNADASIVGDNGNYHFDLDLSALEDGLHSISYLLYNDHGSSTNVITRYFIKVPLGGNAIGQYQYWMNEDDISKATTVKLTKKVNPYQLMTLLPMESRPIRSTQFHFELKDGQPMVYAENTINLRFYDASLRFSDATKSFVDYSVGKKLTDISTLESGISVTFDKIEDNDIKWYQLYAESGDSLQFKLDQACTIQLFSPSGKKLHDVSGSESVSWNGLHVYENGTFYLALHDVTSTKGTSMTLRYNHIDKYDVLRQDVDVVGNGGYSTITFDGNGFNDLHTVLLINSQQDTILHDIIGHETDARTSVSFDFVDKTTSTYDAVFKFTEGEKRIPVCITVDEAEDINIQIEVSSDTRYLINREATYNLCVSNNGNMTAYRVPLYVQLRTPTRTGISKITIQGLDLPTVYDLIMANDTLTEYEKEDLRQLSDIIGDSQYFNHLEYMDENGDSCINRIGIFYITIPPKTNKSISIKAIGNETIEGYFSLYEDWAAHKNIENENSPYNVKKRLGGLGCYTEELTCIKDIVVITLNLFGKGNCGLSVLDAASSYSGMNWSVGISILDIMSSCGLGYRYKDLKLLLDYGWLYPIKKVQTIYNCIKTFTRNRDCDKRPIPPGPYRKKPVRSLDPNEIYGYLSDAGSKFIADTVEIVNYTIEFENDTTFATAAAHTIVVNDTLDAKYFDLDSFVPTGVKIGQHTMYLDKETDIYSNNGRTSFLKTIDMRPEINVLAQVEGSFNHATGIAEWRFTSLDPMTVEETDDVMQGILPVNYDGTSGIGEVMFDIGVKPNKADGTKIPNQAGIVFDTNEKILTPVWVNTVDAVAPTSYIKGAIQSDESKLTLRLAGEDNRSGVWKYNVYAQTGEGASWELVAENVMAKSTADNTEGAADGEAETLCDVPIFVGIEYGFCVLATDSAGNVERKELTREFELTTVLPGDANSDGEVNALDIVLVTNYFLGREVYLNFAAADVNGDDEVNSLDVVEIQNIYLNKPSSIKQRTARRRKQRN